MTKPRGKRVWMIVLMCVAAVGASQAQTLKTLATFDIDDGDYPAAYLVQGSNGDLYSTTSQGGNVVYASGTVFRVTTAGKLTSLYSFGGPDGAYPSSGLVQTTSGDFYGTTSEGGLECGQSGCGTIFEITPGGKLTTLHSFGGRDGSSPTGLVHATDGNFYGTTFRGGAHSYGTVFKITSAGKLTTLYSFCVQSNCADGSYSSAQLVQASDGDFYGTTREGGTNGDGTVFKITAEGELTTLHSFSGVDGALPMAGLVLATNGYFYGMTYIGGAHNEGTIFKMTPQGTLTTLYSFCAQTNCADGREPFGELVQATDGNFYGTTSMGGNGPDCSAGCGTAFKITAAGGFTRLYNFCSQTNCNDGAYPESGLVQDTNGKLYGTTAGLLLDRGTISSAGEGTIFSLSVGLGPFVGLSPASGKVGTTVIVLGTNLSGATGVTFNGIPAGFAVISSSEIKTSVPTGATTGYVRVRMPKKTLNSNVVFRVTK